MLAVVVSFDQFPFSLLGCYGDAEVRTPVIDRIAARSVVFDQHFGEDFSSEPQGHAWWSGCRHFPKPDEAQLSRMPSLPGLLREAGVTAIWVTDDADSPSVPLPRDADVVVLPDYRQVLERGAALLGEWSNEPAEKRLLWLKLGRSVWEGGENAELSADQIVEQIDASLGPVWEQVQAMGQSRPVLFLITAARGLPLRERVDASETPADATEESVHLPLIVYHSEQTGGERRFAFTQTTDIPAALLDFFAAERPEFRAGFSFLQKNLGGDFPEKEAITYGSDGCWEAIRTREFHLIRWRDLRNPDGNKHCLFLKPEDVWDWHDVSAQEPEMTETLSIQLDASLELRENRLPADQADSES